MLQGTVPAVAALRTVSTGSRKPVALPADWTDAQALSLLRRLEHCEPAALRTLLEMTARQVTPDLGRQIISRPEFVAAHFGAAARPPGHGFVPAGATTGQAYAAHDHGQVRLITLDTVDEYGGWQGSLDRDQLHWLAGGRARRGGPDAAVRRTRKPPPARDARQCNAG